MEEEEDKIGKHTRRFFSGALIFILAGFIVYVFEKIPMVAIFIGAIILCYFIGCIIEIYNKI